MHSEQIAIRTTWLSILSNILLAGIKFVAGFIGNSYALIADGIESSADLIASLFVLLGFKYAQKPADDNHPYGHGKIEPLVTFMIVAFLMMSAAIIAYKGILNVQSPQEVPEAWTLGVLLVIIIWKELSYQYVIQKSKSTHSSSLKAEAWHHRSDAITSVLAFIGISIALIGGEKYAVADDYAAILAAGFIIYNSFLIFRPALGEIMDEHFYDEFIGEIRSVAGSVEGVVDTEKCYVRKAGMKYHVDLHAIVDGEMSVKNGHEVAHKVKDALMGTFPNISDVLIHIEPDHYLE